MPKSRGESHFQPSVVCSVDGSLCHFPLLFFSQNFGYNYHLTWKLQFQTHFEEHLRFWVFSSFHTYVSIQISGCPEI